MTKEQGKVPGVAGTFQEGDNSADITRNFPRVGFKNLKDILSRWRNKNIAESDSSHRPENFHSRGEEGWYPDRIVEETPRIKALRELIGTTVGDDTKTGQRLFDLVVYNAHANVFPPANSAADMFGVVDEKIYGEKYRDCIVLIKRAKGGMLAPIGGFLDMGEGPAQGGKREAQEESGARLGRGVPVAVLSDPSRDDRFAVISSVFANILDMDPAHLKHGDDAAEVVVVKLRNEDGSLNNTYFTPGEVEDVVSGEIIKHKGMFAGHDDTIRQLHAFSESHKGEGRTLSEQVTALSTLYPQSWFEGSKAHPEGTDNYKILDIPGRGKLLETPNIQFALKQAERIFRHAGISRKNAAEKAQTFVFDAVNHPQLGELLPKFPQSSVTVDNIVLTGDNKDMILLERLETGEFALPGKYYSKEQTDKGESTERTAKEAVKTKYQTDLTNVAYLGPVGGTVAIGRQADYRYPRISHVYIGEAGEKYFPNAAALGPGRERSRLVALPLLNADGSDLNEELLRTPWLFSHRDEILRPLLPAIKYQIEQRQRQAA